MSTQKLFIEATIHNSGLDYKKEFKFCDTRKFKADYFVPSLQLIVEYEGLWFSNSKVGSGKSRHTSVKGYTNDTEKYNIATLLGYKVLRYTAISYKQFAEDFNTIRNKMSHD